MTKIRKIEIKECPNGAAIRIETTDDSPTHFTEGTVFGEYHRVVDDMETAVDVVKAFLQRYLGV